MTVNQNHSLITRLNTWHSSQLEKTETPEEVKRYNDHLESEKELALSIQRDSFQTEISKFQYNLEQLQSLDGDSSDRDRQGGDVEVGPEDLSGRSYLRRTAEGFEMRISRNEDDYDTRRGMYYVPEYYHTNYVVNSTRGTIAVSKTSPGKRDNPWGRSLLDLNHELCIRLD